MTEQDIGSPLRSLVGHGGGTSAQTAPTGATGQLVQADTDSKDYIVSDITIASMEAPDGTPDCAR